MTVQESDTRDLHKQDLEQVRRKRDRLAPDSQVRAALTDDLLNDLQRRIDSTLNPSDLDYARWPFVYSFVVRTDDDAIAELDADLALVLQHTTADRHSSATRFLNLGPSDHPGLWYGGLFETWAKATLLRVGTDVCLDVPAACGRDHDICGLICGRRFHLECTVINEDDEARQVWQRFLADVRTDPNKILVRPGPYDPPNAKGPSPYYMALRLYAKVYDKIAKELNPDKSQFDDAEPNVLLVCCAPPVTSDNPGMRWGVEELFCCHPRMARTIVPETFTDISLEAWTDFTAKDLIRKKQMTTDWYCENSTRVLEAPRKLGALVVFDRTRLSGGRVNYNASDQCSVRHGEVAELERLLTVPCKYFG